jgi:hypothetical protein
MFMSSHELTVYKQNYEPIYFDIGNMEQFNILGYFNELILQLKEDNSIFTMTLCGMLKPLVE